MGYAIHQGILTEWAVAGKRESMAFWDGWERFAAFSPARVTAPKGE